LFVEASAIIESVEPSKPTGAPGKEPGSENDPPEPTDPNDSDLLRDKLKGQTLEHAVPPRLEDEGQSGG